MASKRLERVPVLDVKSAVRDVKQNALRAAWLDAYMGGAQRDAVEAAKAAGYKRPGSDGPAVERRLQALIELRDAELRATAEVQPREVVVRLSVVARDAEHKDHVRALELLARIHGMVSEKFNVKVDKATLLRELDGEVERLIAGLEAQQRS
jgi:hypothetical protein